MGKNFRLSDIVCMKLSDWWKGFSNNHNASYEKSRIMDRTLLSSLFSDFIIWNLDSEWVFCSSDTATTILFIDCNFTFYGYYWSSGILFVVVEEDLRENV